MEYYYGEVITLFLTAAANLILLLNLLLVYTYFKIKRRHTFKWDIWLFITIIFFIISLALWGISRGLHISYTLFFPMTILTIIVIFKVKIKPYIGVLLITPLYWRYISYMIATFEPYGVPYTDLIFNLDIISILLIMFTIPIIMIVDLSKNNKNYTDQP